MSASPDLLEWLVRPDSGVSGIDRKALAGALLNIARNVKPDSHATPNDGTLLDIRLEQLRELLLGREINAISRLSRVIEDPEQLAHAVSEVLAPAFAEATSDARLGQVFAPVLEHAAQSSIRKNPRALINILYPLIVPAIRKSIGETIDATFQSLNESLKHSLTWHGLKWRWEAWRTGVPFAQVVLNHNLVYQVEHAFLIHRHTGLLICHAAAENAATQDPQLVSSMLSAIQDFVRDSFTGADQGLDVLRLGEFRLWSEPGPFATLVAVIRGNPPESLHQTLHDVVTRIHTERHQALEDFNGDSSGFADIEAELTQCVTLRQGAPFSTRSGLRWLIVMVLTLLLAGGGSWEFRRWQDARRFDDYLAQVRLLPGVVITHVEQRDGKYEVTGLRDPLATDPQLLMKQANIDPARATFHWSPYQALDPQIVLKRLRDWLPLPTGAELSIDGDRIVARGAAPSAWLERARMAAQMLPQGAPLFDYSAVANSNEQETQRWNDYVARLHLEPGIVVTGTGQHDDKYWIEGLRDPLAADPQKILSEAGLVPSNVESRWSPYESLNPQIALRRLQASLDPPPTVRLTVEGDRILATGSAPSLWLDRAHLAARMLPAGGPRLDLSQMQNLSGGALGELRTAIQSRTILFSENDPLPASGQDALLDQLAHDLNQLASLSSSINVGTHVTLTGHADAVGTGTFNLSLSLARAEAVRALLKKRGVDPNLLAVRGAGSLEPLSPEASETARSANRRVSFSVEIEGRS